MASRLRKEPDKLFDVFAEVANDGSSSWVLWKYPDSFENQKVLQSVAEFSFPSPMDDNVVQLFSFVLTDLSGCYTFGFCRHTPRSRTCFCFLSPLPWPEVFFKLLNHLAIAAGQISPAVIDRVLTNLYESSIPRPGDVLTLQPDVGIDRFACQCPDPNFLPKIPENRYLTEYYNAVSLDNMMIIFASMLCERRIIFTGSKIGKLSSCVMAANLLIYPMHWQHIFIPVLPAHLCHYLNAPIPYMIGVLSKFYTLHSSTGEVDLTDAVVLDVDSNVCQSPFADMSDLPSEVMAIVKKNLRPGNMIGDGIARSFLRGLVTLIGGYREALQFQPGESIVFNPELFLQSRPASLRPFLDRILHLQLFSQFIDDRLDQLNKGVGMKADPFDEECNLYSGKESNKFKSQYNDWLSNMKKEGGALVRNLKNKVKSKSRETISDIRGMMADAKTTDTENYMPKEGATVSAAHRLKDKLTYRRSLPLKHVQRANWTQLHREEDCQVVKDVQSPIEVVRNSADAEGTLFSQESLVVAEESRTDLMSELKDVLSRRSSLLLRLEKQAVNDGHIRHARNELVLPPSDLIDLTCERAAQNSSQRAEQDESNLDILTSIFTSPQLPPNPPQGDSSTKARENWETFD